MSTSIPISEHGLSRKTRRDSEPVEHRSRDIRKGIPGSEIGRFHLRPRHQKRRILPRMIRRFGIGRIAAVVCGDHQKIVRSETGQKFRQFLIETGQSPGVSVHIPPVAVEHIVIHQIDETQPVELLFQVGKGFLDPVFIARRGDELRDPFPREDIPDLW